MEGVNLRKGDEAGKDIADSQLARTDEVQQPDTEASRNQENSQLDIVDVAQQNGTETSEDKASLYLNPSLALTTHLDKHWLIRLEGLRTISRHRLSTLYFDTDYISLNPLLQPEKAWNGQATLKYHQGAKFEVNLSGFARRIDDLVIFIPQTEPPQEIGVQSAAELAWTPTNINASIYGGQLLISAHIVDRLDLRFQYTHEASGHT